MSLCLDEATLAHKLLLATFLNLMNKNKPTRISEVLNNFSGQGGFLCNDTVVVCKIENNGVDNPGNSVFGPKGVICPGNIVTSLFIKAMIDLMNRLDYDIVGDIEYDKKIRRINNENDVRFVSKAYKQN